MNDFKVQPFYQKLKSKTIRDTLNVLSGRKHNILFQSIEYLIYALLTFLIYLTLPSFKGNFNEKSLIFLGIAMALIIFLLPIVKKSQETYKKMTDDYRDSLSRQICNCSDKCDCKNELKEYLKTKKVKML